MASCDGHGHGQAGQSDILCATEEYIHWGRQAPGTERSDGGVELEDFDTPAV